jgi:hypothetical protein
MRPWPAAGMGVDLFLSLTVPAIPVIWINLRYGIVSWFPFRSKYEKNT